MIFRKEAQAIKARYKYLILNRAKPSLFYSNCRSNQEKIKIIVLPLSSQSLRREFQS